MRACSEWADARSQGDPCSQRAHALGDQSRRDADPDALLGLFGAENVQSLKLALLALLCAFRFVALTWLPKGNPSLHQSRVNSPLSCVSLRIRYGSSTGSHLRRAVPNATGLRSVGWCQRHPRCLRCAESSRGSAIRAAKPQSPLRTCVLGRYAWMARWLAAMDFAEHCLRFAGMLRLAPDWSRRGASN